jgi:hypothetical protein
MSKRTSSRSQLPVPDTIAVGSAPGQGCRYHAPKRAHTIVRARERPDAATMAAGSGVIGSNVKPFATGVASDAAGLS